MATTYTRPSDWLTIPTVASSAQTFVGLFAVFNTDANYVALQANTLDGGYQVDWGDGIITTHSNGSKAEHKYEYSAISESTLCSRGYKQVLVTVTRLPGSLNMVYLGLRNPHSALGTVTNKKAAWLEYLINLPYATSLGLYYQGQAGGVLQSMVEKITINGGTFTSFTNYFSSMASLKSVNIVATTSGVTNTVNMFSNCYSLMSVNLFDVSSVTDAGSMFVNCSNLEEVPNFNFSKLLTGNSLFSNCKKLKTAPAFNMLKNNDFGNMFNGCVNLTEIGLIDTRSGTSFNNFANSCSKLKTVANLNMSGATTATGAFSTCPSLDNFPGMNVGAANCNLTTFLYNTNMLKKVGDMDVSKVTNFSNFFAGNNSLRTLPALNLNSGTTLTTMVSNVMARAPFTNVRTSLSLANKNLGKAMIVEVFNGLASGVTSKTITVSANPGYGALTAADRLIATAKGWTIA